MTVTHTSREATYAEIAAEMDRRGLVIENLEARVANLEEELADAREWILAALNDWEPDMSKEFDGPIMAQLVKNNDALRGRVAQLEGELGAYREAVLIDAQMDGPKFMGCNVSQLRRAWGMTRAALKDAPQ